MSIDYNFLQIKFDGIHEEDGKSKRLIPPQSSQSIITKKVDNLTYGPRTFIENTISDTLPNSERPEW